MGRLIKLSEERGTVYVRNMTDALWCIEPLISTEMWEYIRDSYEDAVYTRDEDYRQLKEDRDEWEIVADNSHGRLVDACSEIEYLMNDIETIPNKMTKSVILQRLQSILDTSGY